MSETIGFIETALSERRSLERAFADLVAEHDRSPRPDLARMIRGLRTEITQRKRFGETGGAGLHHLSRLIGSLQAEHRALVGIEQLGGGDGP